MTNTSTECAREELLLLGVVQTSLNSDRAWLPGAPAPQIQPTEDVRAWLEILKAIRSFLDGPRKPSILLLPELSLPRTRLRSFDRLVASLNVIAIVGVDFRLDRVRRSAANEGLVFVPTGFYRGRPSKQCLHLRFGKTHAAPEESSLLAGLNPPWTFKRDSNFYVFDLGSLGKIGIAICYDFMDVERALIYRGQIHHFLVIAHNKDVAIFQSIASSLARTVYCNVVVCNTGQFGGSLAVSPFRKPHRRIIYGHNGADLFTTQVIELPVRNLELAMQGVAALGRDKEPLFKEPPPGFSCSI